MITNKDTAPAPAPASAPKGTIIKNCTFTNNGVNAATLEAITAVAQAVEANARALEAVARMGAPDAMLKVGY
jgi:hypothetical protein